MVANTVFFTIFSLVAVISALVMITRKHPLSAALSLVVTFISLAGLYVLLSAKFVFIIQILVYAGAIMILVIFSIMLLNVRDEDLPPEKKIIEKSTISLALTIPALLVVFAAIKNLPNEAFPAVLEDYGTINSLGLFLYTKYTFPFEVISILLLIALVGVVVLAKRRI